MYGKDFFVRNRGSHRISFDAGACVGCSACVQACPMCRTSDPVEEARHARAICRDRCLTCYRCVSTCPVGAISAVPVRGA